MLDTSARTVVPRAFACSLVTVLSAWIGAATHAEAHGSCTAVRMRASGNKCRAVVKCAVIEAKRGTPSEPCVAEQLSRLERQFGKSIIYGDCHSYGEAADVVAILDGFAADLAQVVQLDTDPCTSAKMGAAARGCFSLLRDCYARADRLEIPVEQACIDAVADKLFAAFERAETRFDCATTGDAAAASEATEDAVASVVMELTVEP